MKPVAVAVAAALSTMVGLLPAAAQQAQVDKSDNVRSIKLFEYVGGSHIAFGDGYAYAGQVDGRTNRNQDCCQEQGGIHIFDISARMPKKVGFLHCPGNDHDIAFVKPGLIAVAYHENLSCGAEPEPYAMGASTRQDGVFTVDVSNPRDPKVLGAVAVTSHEENRTLSGRAHTLAHYPGTDYVYVGGGGLSASQIGVSIVDVSNPRKPKVAAVFKPNATGCHDLSIFVKGKKKLGFCAGATEAQIWDVSKPLKPRTIARIHNPFWQVPHYALASPDGKLLVIDDEAIGFHDCGDEDLPFGAVWVYDISNVEQPRLLSYFSPPRGNPRVRDTVGIPFGTFADNTATLCTSHEYNFMAGTRNLVISWYTGGWSILDLSKPEEPREVAYYQPTNADTWTAYAHGGRVYSNDLYRGFEVFDVDLGKGRHHH